MLSSAQILGFLVRYELMIQIAETGERHHYWKLARQYCDSVNKPLLRIGMRRSILEPPNGDVTLDLDPEVLKIQGGILGDERRMPFRDKQFGVSFNEHTIEHLPNPQDVDMAVKECVRVADVAIILAPSPYSIYANLFCPTHYLRTWLSPKRNEIEVVANRLRTGLGARIGRTVALEQVLVCRGIAPQVKFFGNSFIASDRVNVHQFA